MSVTIKVYPSSVPLSEIPVGEAFRRISDGKFFFRTNERSQRPENEKVLETFLCVDAYKFEVDRIRTDIQVQKISRTVISFYFGEQENR